MTAHPSELITFVLDGLTRREAEAQMISGLVERGVPASEAPALFAAIKTAAQQGVQAALTDGHSGGAPSDPLLAEAFRAGQARFREASGGGSRGVLIVALVVGLVAIAAVVLFRS